MSISDFSDDIDEISVIDVRSGDRTTPFEHRVVPVSQTTKAFKTLMKDRSDVQLAGAAGLRISHSAVEPDLLVDIRPERHRVETGWLTLAHFRAYTLLLSPAIENDRLLDGAHYAADPDTTALQRVLSMPAAHETDAALVYTDAMEDILDTVDRSFRRVWENNPQEVGRRIVERPLTVVPAVFRNSGHHPADDLSIVDGNSRWASCIINIQAPPGMTGTTTGKNRNQLFPSHLMRLPLVERRNLVREVIKAVYRDLGDATGTNKAARAKREQAAALLNAMTVPVQAIIGYTDDDPSMGMKRFPVAVRSMLMRMNVGVKPFENASKHSVTAEETVTALFDKKQFTGDAQAVKDVLLGRTDITTPMKTLGFSALRDLRFAYVANQLTRKNPQFNAIMAAKLDKRSLQLAGRSGLVTELGLRSYSTFLGDDIKPVRTALESGCLWKDLVDHEWTVENIDDDQAVDDLLRRTENGDIPAKLLLGVLAMVTLVTCGYLLAPGGSAEQIVDGRKIMRTGVGTVIQTILGKKEGPQVLADAIKRIRAGLSPRWWAGGGLVEQENWKGSDFNAHLRLAAASGFDPEGRMDGPTSTEREGSALTLFQENLIASAGCLEGLIELRKENGTTDLLPWESVESSVVLLKHMAEDLGTIREREPRG
ncbi:hypothetical protein [Streptomyces hydrogenans]|uniref:hypothetical protein n=1 Tax=Streptomyces hydrogenans TaxID=1873719 RepID=UPI0035DA9928